MLNGGANRSDASRCVTHLHSPITWSYKSIASETRSFTSVGTWQLRFAPISDVKFSHSLSLTLFPHFVVDSEVCITADNCDLPGESSRINRNSLARIYGLIASVTFSYFIMTFRLPPFSVAELHFLLWRRPFKCEFHTHAFPFPRTFPLSLRSCRFSRHYIHGTFCPYFHGNHFISLVLLKSQRKWYLYNLGRNDLNKVLKVPFHN